MNTALVTCPRCDGSGRYNAPSHYGSHCFRCKGGGEVRPTRERAVKTRKAPKYIPLDPYVSSLATCRFYGAEWNILQLKSAQLAWARGAREIRRDAVFGGETDFSFPRYR